MFVRIETLVVLFALCYGILLTASLALPAHNVTEMMIASPKCGVSRSMVVMSRARSGSSFICDIVSRKLGYKNPRNDGEILGTSWREMKNISDPLGLIRRKVCQFGSRTGFYLKWKPVYWSSDYLELLRWIAKERIPVVYNVRNPLDVYLSNLKHESNHSVSSRCHPSNFECLELHHRHQRVKVDIPSLLTALKEGPLSPYSLDDDNIRALLTRERVNYFPVQYEILVSDDNTKRLRAWRQVFEFLSPSQEWSQLTLADTLSKSLAPTSSSSHQDKILNYDEVRQALRGSRFAPLLD